MKNLRLTRINEELKELIAEIIQNELNDPRITGFITVLKVETDNELDFANTLISIYASKDEKQTLDALNSSCGYIRKLLSKKLTLRKVPVVVFKVDKGREYEEEINKILSKLDIPKDDENNGEEEK